MAELALVADLAAFVLFALAHRRAEFARIARFALALAGVSLVALIVRRSILISFPALTGTYEGLVVLAFAINAFAFFGFERIFRRNTRLLAATALVAFVYLAVLSSPLVSSALYPPVPVLRSSWLVLHVAFAFVGLALFTVGLVAAILGLVFRDGERAAAADGARDDAVAIGFVFYAVGGLVFGAIWAEAAWGRFWGWDPKETWALITTLYYAAYLHLRFVRKIKQTTARILVVVAWFVAGFTFWGVNALMSGLHAYA